MAASGFPGSRNEDDTQNIADSPFVTTSDVLNQLNKHLSNLSSPEDDDHMQPRFELQKRLPDGSAIPASAEEIAAADFKTKLEQSAKFVSQLATPQDRQFWAEQQRQLGNAFFGRGDYKGAMDIYLTCLVVKDNSPDFVNETLLPILNNLAQCAAQLGMHKKTILFCEMALEEASKAEEQHQQTASTVVTAENEPRDMIAPIQVVDNLSLCKIYFKKAKALRLTGDYVPARAALNASMEHLEKKGDEMSLPANAADTAQNVTSLEPFQQAIQKEFKHLDIAEKEARKNRQRQKAAMQRAMTSSNGGTNGTVSQNQPEMGLGYHSIQSSTPEPRKFSQLRARKTAQLAEANSEGSSEHTQPSYTDFYWSMVERVARYVLRLIGDDEIDDKEEKRKNV
jgi:tetratricopeptide (TPR) repeat protein